MDESLNIELGRFFATSCYVDTFKKTSWAGKRDVEIFKKCLCGKKIIKTQIIVSNLSIKLRQRNVNHSNY